MEPDLMVLMDDLFVAEEKDYTQYSPLTLAWLGDSVYDLIVRNVLVKHGNRQAAKLHKQASDLVCATFQAKMIAALLPELTEEETAVYRRGHNASPGHGAKNATKREYLEATGFEALIGYLFLQKNYKRILELIRSAWDSENADPEYIKESSRI